MKPLASRRILIFVGDDYEDLELWYPKLRLTEAGASITLAGLEAEKTYHGKNGYPAMSDASVAEIRPAEFDALIIPGGWMPDLLRRDPKVLDITRHFAQSNKLIASICHGPWINISAGICKGVKMTSTPAIKDDLINAGALWSDAPVVVDRNHISSRRPVDLPDFCEQIIAFLSRA